MRRLALIFLYPLLDRAHTLYWQHKIFTEWEEGLLLEDMDGEEDASVEQDALGGDEFYLGENAGEPEISENTVDEAISYNTLGILEIEKIGLKLPVLRGTSDAILKIGAGLLEGTAEVGESGNTVLAAHRSHTYGRFFNRLDELEVGDKITIFTSDEHYQYTVYNTVLVEAGDTSILGASEDEWILTLYTCDPLYSVNPPNRLIVQAKMDK